MAFTQWKEGTASADGHYLRFKAFRLRPFPAIYDVTLDNGIAPTKASGAFPKIEGMLMDNAAPQGIFNAFVLLGMALEERMPWTELGSAWKRSLGALSFFPQDMNHLSISAGIGMEETRDAVIGLCRERYISAELHGSVRYRLTQKGAIADRILSTKLIRLGLDPPSDVLEYIQMKTEALGRIMDFYRARMEYGILSKEAQ